MDSAEEENYGGRRQKFHSQERGLHRRDKEHADREGRESGRHGPSDADTRNNRNEDREGRGDVQAGGHRTFSSGHQQRSRDDSSGHRRQRSGDHVLKGDTQRSWGVDDVSRKSQDVHAVLSDRGKRSGWDVDGTLGDHNQKKQDVDDFQRRWDVGNIPDDGNERRRDLEDTRDNRSWHRRDLNVTSGDRSARSQGVNDVLDDGRRRRDADDVPGDSSRRRHDFDGDYSQRRRDFGDGFNNHKHHGGGVRDQQQRSPHKRSSHHEKRATEEDHFSAQFRNAERREDELPELFSVYRAKVQSVRPFGVFVRLEGFHKQGLVHLSQLSDHEVTDREDSDEMKVKAIATVAAEGDQVWVKVISLKDDGGGVKIGCSLKLVSQSTGKDLDPNNVKLDQHQPKGTRQELKKVTLDAIYNVVCSRCGGHGHLKTECYGMANKSYELIPEEDDDLAEQLPQPPQTQKPLEAVSVKPGFGRGRAMVLPAWMTHGTGLNPPLGGDELEKKKKKRKESELPDKVTTVEEAMALIAQVKKEKKDKHHRKEHKKHKKSKHSKKSSNKESSSWMDRG